MLVRKPDDEGFGLVEVIIAMFLLAIITIALLPALMDGIRRGAEQSTTATATRQLNALIDQARQTPTCANLTTVSASQSFLDGSGHAFTTARTTGSSTTCASGSAATLSLTATDSSGVILATIDALVYVP